MALPLAKDRYIESITVDVERLLVAVEAAPEAPVVACPGWSNTDLMDHVSGVFEFAAAQVLATATEMVPSRDSTDTDAAERFRTSSAALLGALAAADPDAEGWNWAGEPTLAFYFRRMACEIAVHRIDAQRAAGATEDPIDADIATDGVDEVFEVGMQFRRAGANATFPAGSLHLHRTDGDGEWLVRAAEGTLVLTHEHAKGDAAVRGGASDLMLFLWRRGRGSVEIFGDEAVAEAWAAVAP